MTENQVLIKTPEEAIETIKSNMPTSGYQMLRESLEMAITALKEIQQYREIRTVQPGKGAKHMTNREAYERDCEELEQYRAIGTVEEGRKSVKEEDVLKFYYCESKDDYYIGKRVGNFYYARYGETVFEWFMSRYLPWGEHVVEPNTLWKEHTYPSEPKEISFFEWLQGFVKKYCGGTVEECREAVKKQGRIK